MSQPQPPLLMLMRGVSGSGKSTVARELAAHLPAIHVRSDVERKRLFGLAPLAQSKSGLGSGLYTADATQRTYERLKEIAQLVLDAGFSVVLDATFLKHSQRAMFEEMGKPYLILACEAPNEVLRARVALRHAAQTDAAEADLTVLEKQLATHEASAERAHAILLDTLNPSRAQPGRPSACPLIELNALAPGVGALPDEQITGQCLACGSRLPHRKIHRGAAGLINPSNGGETDTATTGGFRQGQRCNFHPRTVLA